MLKITEIFKSIQGESSFAGYACTFIRLAGCNLDCTWCDTKYFQDKGENWKAGDILNAIQEMGCPLVEFTGGEPLLQQEVYPLITRVLDTGYQVLVETNGSIHLGQLDPRAVKVMDVKCPGSGMSHKMNWSNVDLLKERDEVKFVISNRADYDWAVGILKKFNLPQKALVVFSPVFGTLESRHLAEWILADHLPVRLQLQLHKYIWDPSLRGV